MKEVKGKMKNAMWVNMDVKKGTNNGEGRDEGDGKDERGSK